MEIDEWELIPNTKSLLDLEILDNHDPHEDYSVSDKLFSANDGKIVDANYFMCPPHPLLFNVQSKENSTPLSQNIQLQEPSQNQNFEQAKLLEDTSSVRSVHVSSPDVLSNADVECSKHDTTRSDGEQETHGDVMEEDGESSKTEAAFSEEEYIGVWRWPLRGIGALCSMGVAAATILAFALGGQHQQQQKIQFQVFADDKRMKHAVQRAARLNRVMSAVQGGTPTERAQISFGGYYNGLRSIDFVEKI